MPGSCKNITDRPAATTYDIAELDSAGIFSKAGVNVVDKFNSKLTCSARVTPTNGGKPLAWSVAVAKIDGVMKQERSSYLNAAKALVGSHNHSCLNRVALDKVLSAKRTFSISDNSNEARADAMRFNAMAETINERIRDGSSFSSCAYGEKAAGNASLVPSVDVKEPM